MFVNFILIHIILLLLFDAVHKTISDTLYTYFHVFTYNKC